MDSKKYLFKFYYIATEKFYGSQRQSNISTIEDCIIKVLKKKNYINNIRTSGFEVASRTDRFVSARNAAFSVVINKRPILMQLNSLLPIEIGIWSCSEVPIDFSPRFNAIYRHYKYIVPTPLSAIRKECTLNLDIIKKVCKELEGPHDFKNFYKQTKQKVNTKREMNLVELEIIDDYLIFDFISKAFLRQQIRRMVKKIMELGLGMISYDEFLMLLDSSNEISYQPADPSGLILWDIKFDEKIIFEIDKRSKERMEQYFFNQMIIFGHKRQLFSILQQNYVS